MFYNVKNKSVGEEKHKHLSKMILMKIRYADIVDVGHSVLIENQNRMVPSKVEHISVQANTGNDTTQFS